jgi:hypothetical protein
MLQSHGGPPTAGRRRDVILIHQHSPSGRSAKFGGVRNLPVDIRCCLQPPPESSPQVLNWYNNTIQPSDSAVASAIVVLGNCFWVRTGYFPFKVAESRPGLLVGALAVATPRRAFSSPHMTAWFGTVAIEATSLEISNMGGLISSRFAAFWAGRSGVVKIKESKWARTKNSSVLLSRLVRMRLPTISNVK